MSRPEAALPRYHYDASFFTEAIAFTAARLGFIPALIEKDYFCSLVLAYLAGSLNETLVFKGGTCLTKVHAGFYRLSEDLDFAMPMPIDARQSDRSRTIKPVKETLREMCETLPELREEEALRGANGSRQYVGSLSYESPLQRRRETIKIEIGLREPLLQKAAAQGAATVLLNPLSQRSLVAPVQLSCIAKPEALAEKCRAAMTRREPAIRDYFDIDYAVRNGEIGPSEASWLQMVGAKIAVPGNESVDVSVERLHALRR
jgi:predicted nucleotidyltransferase component of viral defense system